MLDPVPEKVILEASSTVGVISSVLPLKDSGPNPNPVIVFKVKSMSSVYAKYCSSTDVNSACETGVFVRFILPSETNEILAPINPGSVPNWV